MATQQQDPQQTTNGNKLVKVTFFLAIDWRFVNVMARALVALGRKPDYEQINRYASYVEALLIDYFEPWLDAEQSATGWREEVFQPFFFQPASHVVMPLFT